MILTLLLTVCLSAQTGDISGVVIDKETQSPLIGVNVVVIDTDWGAATDLNGRYHIRNIPVGTYNLTFHMMGYEKLEKLNIPVSPDRITQMDVSLGMISILGEEVVVTATAFVKARDAVVSDRNIDYTEMIRDPGSAMDVQRMMQALPAVVSGADQENEIIVRGGEPAENLFLMDNIEIPNPNHFGWQGTGGGP
ncbi:MAG: carboxypeptidase-like regulatory domain-containing protein, partial [Candidatus Marinimicrobia bacterium]|nr:carboxypeptidase-like regulatory domain-containing protein [Candidatus Neomarinimicrobiota bacterium]